MTFIDLFSGIGGFRIGMEQAGHVCIGRCEINKFANQAYNAIHKPKENEWFERDITRVRSSDVPAADCWCFGFPCQDISISGRQRGMGGERSSLFFRVTQLIRDTKTENRPSYLFIENVKNLLSVNRGYDFLAVLAELDEIGYNAEWDVLDTADFGLPQHRERVFIIGHFRGRSTGQVFPVRRTSEKHALRGKINCIGNILPPRKKIDRPQSGKIYNSDGISPTLLSGDHGHIIKIMDLEDRKTLFGDKQVGRVYSGDGISPTLRCVNGGGNEVKILRSGRIRKLTPKEYWRLQGFSDEHYEQAKSTGLSDTQLYNQAGNSVSVPVIAAIAERLEIEK